MARPSSRGFAGQVVHLVLRSRHQHALVRDERDWQALAQISRRMLFWCGGAIHGCRCQGGEMRFAVEVAHATLGAMAHHVSGAYAIHFAQRYGRVGRVFKRYTAFAIDADAFLDDLVLWLHRPDVPVSGDPANKLWTAHDAYLSPQSSAWITTGRVLGAVGRGGTDVMTYRRRQQQPFDAAVLDAVTRPPRRSRKSAGVSPAAVEPPRKPRPGIEEIARVVAECTQVPYELMHSTSRERRVTKAKVVAAVLCTRNGASVAAVARLFRRSRSTLIEQADHYRETQPHLFDEAERALAIYLQEIPENPLETERLLKIVPGKLI